MAIEVKMDDSRDLVIFQCTGKLTRNDLHSALREFYRDSPHRKTLWDLREASLSLTGPETEELARTITVLARGNAHLRPGGKTASLVSSDLDFGIARMYQSYSMDSPVTLHIFRDPEEAMRWLED